jgi:peptidoglycan hydrolase CwlO-like protein
MANDSKQSIFEKYIVQIVSGLVIAGISSFFVVFFQIQKTAELTHQSLRQTQQQVSDLDDMMMGIQKEIKSDLKDINDKLNEISVLNSKMYDLERRIQRLENADKQR